MNKPARKRALVTGAAKRLGRAMALHLGRSGYDVAVHYRSSGKEALEVVDQILSEGQKAVSLQADFLDDAETESMVSRAVASLGGPLTCLVNNASVFEYDTLETATRETWDRHFESNLRAPFVLMQHFAAQAPVPLSDTDREKRAQALVVNMLDQRIRKITPQFMSYSLAKHGLWALTRMGAQALAPKVRVNAIAPGTTLPAARQSQEHFSRQRSASLLGRGASPEDICAALSYLLDAPSVTGQAICVDGGQHLAWRTQDILGFEGG